MSKSVADTKELIITLLHEQMLADDQGDNGAVNQAAEQIRLLMGLLYSDINVDEEIIENLLED